MAETCPTCNRYTTKGAQQRAEEYRQKTISGIDLSKPLSELVTGIRNDLTKARGELQDIGWGYTGWADRLENVQGLLTCGLIALHGIVEEMKESESRADQSAVMEGDR